MFVTLFLQDWDDRDDDDVIIIERILLLIRNVLHISPAPEEEKVEHINQDYFDMCFSNSAYRR